MTRICFWVPGVPVGTPRPRARHIPGGPDGRGFTRIYTPKKEGNYANWYNRVRLFASLGSNRPPIPLEGALKLLVIALFPRPKCLCRKKDHPGIIWAPTAASDWDNTGKVTDILKYLHYWGDDRQVCDGRVLKGFHAIGGAPGALFLVELLPPIPRGLPEELAAYSCLEAS
jgi:Holliday junction resolvase RusA-like endonuclease